MESKVYSKNDILQKLAQDGFFVDYLTLGSFLEKYNIEAIFEDEDGSEYYDKSSYDILVDGILKRKKEKELHQQDVETRNASDDSPLKGFSMYDSPSQEEEKKDATLLETIKWHRWDEVSYNLKDQAQDDEREQAEQESVSQDFQAVEDENFDSEDIKEENIDLSQESFDEEIAQEEYSLSEQLQDEVQEPQVQQDELSLDSEEEPIAPEQPLSFVDQKQEEEIQASERSIMPQVAETNESQEQIQDVINSDDSDEDFDDIGLISDSIQAQEKFQNYIVNELAKKNIDVRPPEPQNAFKLDVSEKTLNMIARTLAKKIAKHVSLLISADFKNNSRLVQVEKKNRALEQQVRLLEEQNKKLKILLTESNKNLNSYKPTFFGLYKFVKRKPKKKR